MKNKKQLLLIIGSILVVLVIVSVVISSGKKTTTSTSNNTSTTEKKATNEERMQLVKKYKYLESRDIKTKTGLRSLVKELEGLGFKLENTESSFGTMEFSGSSQGFFSKHENNCKVRFTLSFFENGYSSVALDVFN